MEKVKVKDRAALGAQEVCMGEGTPTGNSVLIQGVGLPAMGAGSGIGAPVPLMLAVLASPSSLHCKPCHLCFP